MTVKYANNAETTLSSAINTTDATIEVVSVNGFPTLSVGDSVYLTISNPTNTLHEVVLCTAITGTILTVTRGYDNTTARDWTVGSKVSSRLTAGLLQYLIENQASVTESQISDFGTYLTSETNTTISLVNNILTYTDENGVDTNIDLSYLLDDTNLVTSVDGQTGAVDLSTTYQPLEDQRVSTTDDVVFNSVQLSGGAAGEGILSWNVDEETLDLDANGTTLQLGQEIVWNVKNQTGATIPNGTPVMATGTVGTSGRITVAPMVGSNPANAKYFLGVTTETIINGADGKVTHFGKVRDIDTSGYAEGAVLYISTTTAGAFQTTEPTAPNLNLPVAFVITSHANNGVLAVRVRNTDDNAFQPYNANTVIDGSYVHTDNNYTTTEKNKLAGIEAGATADMTASEILTAIKTVDGATSGLDADLLDGQHGSYYTGYTDTAIANLVDSAPATLDTLNELAAALGDDPNFATTVTNSIAAKVAKSGDTMTGNLSFGDSNKATFGAVSDLQIYHFNEENYIVGSKKLSLWGKNLTGNSLVLGAADATYATFDWAGAAQLYYNNLAKLTTTSTGVDVTGDITLSGTVDGRDVAADGTKLDGIEAGATADQTPTEILTAIKTVDGSGSGLDADTLDGQHGSYYAPISSPALTGIPTAPTASAGTNTTQLATTAFVSNAVSSLVDSAPGTLNTLNELAAALGDDPNFATTVTNNIADKVSKSGDTMSGILTLGPNTGYGKYLKIGNNGNLSDANTGSIGVTNGNLHIDAATSSSTYLNFYDGTGGVAFGNGASAAVAWMGPDGDLWKGSSDNSGSKYWHAGNDGSGSGLDADLLDGQHGSYYYSPANQPPYPAETDTLQSVTSRGNSTTTQVIAASFKTGNWTIDQNANGDLEFIYA